MARVERVVCDVCENPRRKIKPYRVGHDGVLVDVVLCREHSAYVEELIEIGKMVPIHTNMPKVWTLEEIERRKRESKKAATDQ